MKRHDFDPLSFISGVLLLGLGLLFLIPRATGDLIDFLSSAALWIWPALFIAAGAAVLVPAVIRMQKGEPEDD